MRGYPTFATFGGSLSCDFFVPAERLVKENCAVFSPDGQTVATSDDHTLRVWDVAVPHLTRRPSGLVALSTLSASSSRADDYSGYNEFVSDPRLNGLGGLTQKAPPIWFSPFRLTPCGKKWKAFGVIYG
jgi:hypothetical protein